jgi:hypothetical protein
MASSLNIPTSAGYAISQTMNVEGSVYFFYFYYNYRSGWYVNLYDSQENPLATGIKVMKAASLFKYTDIFSGSFIVMDTDPVEGDDEVGRDSFGEDRRFQVWYFTEKELQELIEGS